MRPLPWVLQAIPGAAVAVEAPSPAIGEGGGQLPMAGTLVQMLGGLLLVVALIVLFAWLARRLSGLQQSVSGQLRILGGLSMGTREKVVLIQVGEEQLLIGVAPGTVRTLHRLEKPLDVGAVATEPPDFSTRLRELMKGGGPT